MIGRAMPVRHCWSVDQVSPAAPRPFARRAAPRGVERGLCTEP